MGMQPRRIYADTSVFGGCFDDEFAAESLEFFRLVRAGRILLLASDLVVAELVDAPQSVRDVLSGLPPAAVEAVPLTPRLIELRDAYVEAGIVSRRWLDDAGHVAAAAVAMADAIVSWNFKHIVQLDKMKAYNEVNRGTGLPELTIITPLEVVRDDSTRK